MVLQGEHLLQLHMVRDSRDVYLQYPTRYSAEDNITIGIEIRLNRYTTQTQVWQRQHDSKLFAESWVTWGPNVFPEHAKSFSLITLGNFYPSSRVTHLQNWLDARERVGDSTLRDFNGVPYTVPIGMVSTEVRTKCIV